MINLSLKSNIFDHIYQSTLPLIILKFMTIKISYSSKTKSKPSTNAVLFVNDKFNISNLLLTNHSNENN